MSATDETPTCPDCGSPRQAVILYGLIWENDDLVARIESGEVVLGGCCVTDAAPNWRCLACGREWGLSEQIRALEASGRPVTVPVWMWILMAPVVLPFWIGHALTWTWSFGRRRIQRGHGWHRLAQLVKRNHDRCRNDA